MSNETTVGVIVGVTVGVVAAHIGNKVITRLKEEIHEEELQEAKKTAFQEGWAAASSNARNVYNRYKEMFESGEMEKEGTAFKS